MLSSVVVLSILSQVAHTDFKIQATPYALDPSQIEEEYTLKYDPLYYDFEKKVMVFEEYFQTRDSESYSMGFAFAAFSDLNQEIYFYRYSYPSHSNSLPVYQLKEGQVKEFAEISLVAGEYDLDGEVYLKSVEEWKEDKKALLNVFSFADYNQDAHPDFSLLYNKGAYSGTESYTVWIFDPLSEEFVVNEDLTGMRGLDFDYQRKVITSTDAANSHEKNYKEYKMTEDLRLIPL